MAGTSRAGRSRPGSQITQARAARLYRLVRLLGQGGRGRDRVLSELGIGLRTFYRELDLLKRHGIQVRLKQREYVLAGPLAQAEGRLPFPDPRLTFAEMDELSRGTGPAARRLAELRSAVIGLAGSSVPRRARRKPDTTR